MKIQMLLFITALFTCVHIYGQSPINPSVDVKTFVTRQYTHGMPYEEAKAYGPKVLPELNMMLKNLAYEDSRPNIISLMGRIGDKAAINPLMNFLYEQKGEVNYSTFVAVLATFQALGFIAQNHDEALQILSNWSSTDYMQKMGLNISFENYKGDSMAALLSRMAIQGLGVSGRAEALTLLQDIGNPAATKRIRFNPRLNADVQSAIKLNRQVKTQGAAKTFGKSKEQ